jgi:CheY-like chemotaxis protein
MERAAKRRQIAILDFIMPRLDGVEAALLLRRDCPSTRVAVQSSDPDGLKERAAGLGLAVFDKLDVESLLAWVERQAGVWNGLGSTTVAALAPRRDVSCSHVVTASLVASRPNAADVRPPHYVGSCCIRGAGQGLPQIRLTRDVTLRRKPFDDPANHVVGAGGEGGTECGKVSATGNDDPPVELQQQRPVVGQPTGRSVD